MIYSEHGDPLKVLRSVKFNVPEPGTGQVVVQLLAAPVNPSDLLQIDGTYPLRPPKTKDFDPSTPSAVGGIEGVFKVVKVGGDVSSCKEGDWVIHQKASSTWRSHAVFEASDLLVIPESLSSGLKPLQAATVSVNPTTADLMFDEYTTMNTGDWFIQNGGNSGLGRTAIQLAHLRGLKSINVIRNRPDGDEIAKQLTDLGADIVVTEEELQQESFPETLKQKTGGVLPKLALDCVGGKATAGLANTLANGGHFITYGSMTGRNVEIPPWLLVFKDIHIHGFWLTAWAAKTGGRGDLILKLLDYIRQGKLRDVPFTTHEYSVASKSPEEFAKAFREAIDADNKRKGKQAIVIV